MRLLLPLSLLLAAKTSVAAQTVPQAVEIYVTTGDRTKLLHREPDLHFSTVRADGIPVIVIDTATRYQSIVGFGAALTDASAWLIQHELTLPQRESILQDLFGPEPGLGFSFLRLDMGASDFSLQHYSYDDMPAGQTDPTLAHFSIEADRAETLPILERALDINPHLSIMASPWSPPAWMKTTGSMIKGTLRADAYEPFALYFLKFIRAYEAEGVPIFAITVQNEPHFEPENYPGMRLEPAARARFVGRYLGPLLEREGLHTRILDWDHNWDEPDSPLRVLADSAARRYVSGVAWHCYAGEVTAQGPVHDAWPDKDAYFTECSGGDWAPSFADNLAWTVRHLVIGSTRNWSRGVLMWNLALDTHHGPHTGGCGDCRGVVTIDTATGAVTRNEEYYALGHASRFVKPGARRIASTAGARAGGFDNVAFLNDDGTRVVVIVNTNAAAGTFEVRTGGRAVRCTLPPGAVASLRWR